MFASDIKICTGICLSDAHTHAPCITTDRGQSQPQVQTVKSRLRAPRVWWKKLPLRRLARALSAPYLLPDGKSWNRSCAGWDRSAVIGLDLATDRLMTTSSRARSLALSVSSDIPDDTVETSLRTGSLCCRHTRLGCCWLSSVQGNLTIILCLTVSLTAITPI